MRVEASQAQQEMAMTLRKRTLALLIAAALTPQFAATAYAQAPGYAPGYGPAPAQVPARAYTQAQLDQMLAPIALYPDALLSQVLMASTYPIEVVEAARWMRANPACTATPRYARRSARTGTRACSRSAPSRRSCSAWMSTSSGLKTSARPSSRRKRM
jgi:hypothetical protein